MTRSTLRLRYFEDLEPGIERRLGPFVIEAERVMALLGAAGPVSDLVDSTPTGAPPVVPDLFLHGFSSGHGRSDLGFLAIVCIRSATYEPRRLLRVGEPFFVIGRIVAREELNDRMGLAVYECLIVSEVGEFVGRAVERLLVLRCVPPRSIEAGA